MASGRTLLLINGQWIEEVALQFTEYSAEYRSSMDKFISKYAFLVHKNSSQKQLNNRNHLPPVQNNVTLKMYASNLSTYFVY